MNNERCDNQTVALLAALLAAIANPKRLAVLDALRDGEKSVGVLAIEVGLSQSALSQHLTIMRQQGLLTGRKQSQSVFYSTRPDAGTLLITGLRAMLDHRSESFAQALSRPDALTAPIETIEPIPTALGAREAPAGAWPFPVITLSTVRCLPPFLREYDDYFTP